MHKTVDVAYLYEHAARELDVACAVAALLRQRGVQLELLHWPTGFPRAVTHFRPYLVVLPFCYSVQSYLPLLAYWHTSSFFNATWEQLFYMGNRRTKTPRGDFPLRHVIHHAWSRDYARFLEQAGIPSTHVFLNGQPAFSLYDSPYRHYYESREHLAKRHGLEADRRWIFFPENYNWAFYSEAMLQRFIDDERSREDVAAMREYCERSLAEVLQWCKAGATSTPIELILRPRPSTTLDEFTTVVRKFLPALPENLHILQDGSVREWILASEVVVSSHSTSLIEAAVAKKPVYILEPFPIPAPLRVEWQKKLPHLTHLDPFLDVCRGKQAKDRPGAPLERWARTTMMSQGDSISNLADYLLGLLEGRTAVSSPPAGAVASAGLKFVPPAPMWSLYRRAKQFLRYPSSGGIEPWYAKDVTGPASLQARIDHWGEVLAGREQYPG